MNSGYERDLVAAVFCYITTATEGDYLKNNPMATLQEAASGCELSLGGVKKICSKLQEIGVLGREGSKRDGRWIVK